MDKDLAKKLEAIQAGVNDLTLKIETHLTASKSYTEKVVDHETKLYGNGAEGMIIDVDRLKTRTQRQTKLTYIGLAALAPLVVAALWGWAFGGTSVKAAVVPEPVTMAVPE